MSAFTYRPELLGPYLALDQGEKVQAECTIYNPVVSHDISR
jgi:hypothetical protein